MFLTNFAKSKLTKFVFVFMLAFASAPALLPSQAYAAEETDGKSVMLKKVVDTFKNVKLVIFLVGAFMLLKFAYETIIGGGEFKIKEFAMIGLGMLLVGGVGYILEAMVGKENLADAGIGDEISQLNNS